MKGVGYKGILDIGYRLDPRDNKYKVLDINPRVGQAFRLFLANNGMDVIRSLYLDLTGQEQQKSEPREGRRWLIEDYDIISSHRYYKEGSLGFIEWIRSFRRVEEAAWFSWKDPKPFLVIAARFIKKALYWIYKKIVSNIPLANKTIKARD
jgi:predicted ATP-grasp superfamily ATP-dependent carboligase